MTTTYSLLARALLASFSGSAIADHDMGNMPGMNSAAPQAPKLQTHAAIGIVKDADAAAGAVTISHEAIKTLSWPVMTMAFPEKDKSLFSRLVAGTTIDFQLTKQGADYVVTGAR